MKKIIYYLRIFLFIIYLITIFLLINNLYSSNIYSIIYFFLNLIYSFVIILSILSKKEIFKKNIAFNLLNIGIYIYTMMLYYITITNSKLDIITNINYFNKNFILMNCLLIGITSYILITNENNY